MHPEIARRLAEQRRAELLQAVAGGARHRRLWGSGRGTAGWRGNAVPSGPPRSPAAPVPAALWLAAQWLRRGRHRGEPAVTQPAPLAGVFTRGTEAFGLRIYVTPAEAGRVAGECLGLLSEFAGRFEDPGRRPAGAVPFEVVVLGRRLPEPAGAGPGLPGSGPAR